MLGAKSCPGLSGKVLAGKRLAIPFPEVSMRCDGVEVGQRRRLADGDDVVVTITILTTDSNHDSVLDSARDLFQSQESATAILGVAVQRPTWCAGPVDGPNPQIW